MPLFLFNAMRLSLSPNSLSYLKKHNHRTISNFYNFCTKSSVYIFSRARVYTKNILHPCTLNPQNPLYILAFLKFLRVQVIKFLAPLKLTTHQSFLHSCPLHPLHLKILFRIGGIHEVCLLGDVRNGTPA